MFKEAVNIYAQRPLQSWSGHTSVKTNQQLRHQLTGAKLPHTTFEPNWCKKKNTYLYLSFCRISKHWTKALPPPQETSPSMWSSDPRPGPSAAGPERDPTTAGPPQWRHGRLPAATATGGPRAPRGTCCGSASPPPARAPPTEPRRRPPLEDRVRVRVRLQHWRLAGFSCWPSGGVDKRLF